MLTVFLAVVGGGFAAFLGTYASHYFSNRKKETAKLKIYCTTRWATDSEFISDVIVEKRVEREKDDNPEDPRKSLYFVQFQIHNKTNRKFENLNFSILSEIGGYCRYVRRRKLSKFQGPISINDGVIEPKDECRISILTQEPEHVINTSSFYLGDIEIPVVNLDLPKIENRPFWKTVGLQAIASAAAIFLLVSIIDLPARLFSQSSLWEALKKFIE